LSAVTVVHDVGAAHRVGGRWRDVTPQARVAARFVTQLVGGAPGRRRTRISSMPSSVWKASAWNSLCAPLPISAMRAADGRASLRATSAEVAAVRSAVVSVSSVSSSGLARLDVGEHAERHHRGHAAFGVARVAV
jgi:hypothetical protein